MGDFDNYAIKDFNKALSINSGKAKYYYYRGVIYHRSGKKQKALNDFKICCKVRSFELYEDCCKKKEQVMGELHEGYDAFDDL